MENRAIKDYWDQQKREMKRIRRKKNRTNKEKNPSLIERGKEIMRQVQGDDMEMDFRIQARVNVIDIANLALALKKRRDLESLRSLTKLTQQAFRLAVESLLSEDEEITDLEEAIEILEEMDLIDTHSSSAMGAINRNRRRTHRREVEDELRSATRRRREVAPQLEDIDQEDQKIATLNRMIDEIIEATQIGPQTDEQREEIAQEIVKTHPELGLPQVRINKKEQESLKAFAIVESLRIKREFAKRTQEEKEANKPPPVSQEIVDYWNSKGNNLPGLHPTDRKGQVDMVEGESLHDSKERFEEASKRTLADEYGQ